MKLCGSELLLPLSHFLSHPNIFFHTVFLFTTVQLLYILSVSNTLLQCSSEVSFLPRQVSNWAGLIPKGVRVKDDSCHFLTDQS